tara:strand:+ start:135 stop:389 length:255 start_codon:yes stop_codon:yes gene_type:complete
MSLSVNIPSEKTITTVPAETVTVPAGNLKIRRIVDMPQQKKVFVILEELGQIELNELSGDNYDNPAEWTNADVQTAIANYIAAL